MRKMHVVIPVVALLVVFVSGLAGAQMREKQDYWNHKTYDPAASKWAANLACMFPGAGEWYNRDFQGNFPMAECVLGAICPLVSISSVLDAAAGATDTEIRFDFWGPTSNHGY